MAQETLKRAPSIYGNRRTFTLSGWCKVLADTTGRQGIWSVKESSGHATFHYDNYKLWWNSYSHGNLDTGVHYRDHGSWHHVHMIHDSTCEYEADRLKVYVDGVKRRMDPGNFSSSQNMESGWGSLTHHHIAAQWSSGGGGSHFQGYMFDHYHIDGQALGPEVFAYFKDNRGYRNNPEPAAHDDDQRSNRISPGQWLPRLPKSVIKDVNRRGGFGNNGWYLPMNSGKFPGADMHMEPDTILKLKTNQQQPKAEIDGDPKSAVRHDPLAKYLVLALPMVKDGLDSANGTPCMGDYSHLIRNDGSKPYQGNIFQFGSSEVEEIDSWYGSAMDMNDDGGGGTASGFTIGYTSNNSSSGTADDRFKWPAGTDFTIECWIKYGGNSGSDWWSWARSARYSGQFSNSDVGYAGYGYGTTIRAWTTSGEVIDGGAGYIGSNSGWHHVAVDRKGSIMRHYLDGNCIDIDFNQNVNFDNGGWEIGNRYSWTGHISDFRIYKGVAKFAGGFETPRPFQVDGTSYVNSHEDVFRETRDTIMNQFAHFTPNDNIGNNPLLVEGGLKPYGSNNSNRTARTQIGITSGKWYWEFKQLASTPDSHHGLTVGHNLLKAYDGNAALYMGGSNRSYGWYILASNPMFRNGGSSNHNGSIVGLGQNDVGMMAYDYDHGHLWLGKNGAWLTNGTAVGDPESGSFPQPHPNDLPTDGIMPVFPSAMNYDQYGSHWNFGQNPTFGGTESAGTYKDDSGFGSFKYQPPAGFLSLCTRNLPEPPIKNPQDYHRSVLHTGTDHKGQSVRGINFKADLIWTKPYSTADQWIINDTVRGVHNYFYFTHTTSSTAHQTGAMSTNTNGFSWNTWNNLNGDGREFVTWAWKAGGDKGTFNVDDVGYSSLVEMKDRSGVDVRGASIGSGNITPTGCSINTTSKFGIYKYTGVGGGNLVHGLGTTPGWVMVKNFANDHWFCYCYDRSGTAHYYINVNGAMSASGQITTVDDTKIYLGSDNGCNESGDSYIAYVWAPVEGYSAMGHYRGNNSTNGPFVYTGFRPAFLLIKNLSGNHWALFDSSRDPDNPVRCRLHPNTDGATNAGAGDTILFLSNGFRCTKNDDLENGSGDTMMFVAFAEAPYMYASAR